VTKKCGAHNRKEKQLNKKKKAFTKKVRHWKGGKNYLPQEIGSTRRHIPFLPNVVLQNVVLSALELILTTTTTTTATATATDLSYLNFFFSSLSMCFPIFAIVRSREFSVQRPS